jgi:hypothetical protein
LDIRRIGRISEPAAGRSTSALSYDHRDRPATTGNCAQLDN